MSLSARRRAFAESLRAEALRTAGSGPQAPTPVPATTSRLAPLSSRRRPEDHASSHISARVEVGAPPASLKVQDDDDDDDLEVISFQSAPTAPSKDKGKAKAVETSSSAQGRKRRGDAAVDTIVLEDSYDDRDEKLTQSHKKPRGSGASSASSASGGSSGSSADSSVSSSGPDSLVDTVVRLVAVSLWLDHESLFRD
ncbi:hypothetical protein JCM3766R1_005411 [Sporobolomyces carnicolor]